MGGRSISGAVEPEQRAARSGRAPGTVYLLGAVGILLLVTVLAIRPSLEGPPAIAEFAPVTQRQIADAPPEQRTSREDSGSVSSPSPSPSPSAGAVLPGGAVALHCVGDPPRQIEDPQSPPCIPFWQGDNHGSTWKGVDSSRIVVAFPPQSWEDNREEDDLLNFFNQRFEFYGRRLVFGRYTPTDSPTLGGQPTSPATMQADAQFVDQQLHPFADIAYREAGYGNSYAFYDALAARQILSVEYNYTEIPAVGQDHLNRFAPYEWNYTQTPDQVQRDLGDLICNELAGKAPVYAGQSIAATQKSRVFGLIHAEDSSQDATIDVTTLEQAASRCGVSFVESGVQENSPSTAKAAMIQMLTHSVTTVICICHQGDLGTQLMPEATDQGYFPEWMIQHFIHQDDETSAVAYPADQASHLFGLQELNKTQPWVEMPYVWAVHEVDPTYAEPAPQNRFSVTYWNLMVLAAGIQMAGPNLSPDAFQAGLFRTAFPNPGADGPPWYQARVGFGPGNHSMLQSEALVWWSGQTSVETQTPGTFCYTDLGRRYELGNWPRRDPVFFQQPCR